jgi:hypothetical protein
MLGHNRRAAVGPGRMFTKCRPRPTRKINRFALWPLRLGLGRRLLELNVGGQGLDGIDELDQSTVARQVNDPPSAPIEHRMQPLGAYNARHPHNCGSRCHVAYGSRHRACRPRPPPRGGGRPTHHIIIFAGRANGEPPMAVATNSSDLPDMMAAVGEFLEAVSDPPSDLLN